MKVQDNLSSDRGILPSRGLAIRDAHCCSYDYVNGRRGGDLNMLALVRGFSRRFCSQHYMPYRPLLKGSTREERIQERIGNSIDALYLDSE